MMHFQGLTAVCLALWMPWLAATTAGGQTIWQEGEHTDQAGVQRHPWWYDQVKKEALSGGDWVSHWGEKPGVARYPLDVPEDGAYAFWVRANPIQSALSYRIDGGEWKPIGMAGAVDSVNVAADGKPDLRFVAWTRVGDIDLTRGAHAIEFRMHSDNQNHGALDAFVLTLDPFRPMGTARPGDAGTAPPKVEAAWPFTPPHDPFSDEALLDLRYLNEERAGETGFVGLTDDGNGFVRGDGEPIRFWAVVSDGHKMPPADMDRHARFLAKLGVNMVRLHTQIAAEPPEGASDEGASGATSGGGGINDVNEKMIDGIFRFVKACGDQGIYVTLSPYWAHFRAPQGWDLEGVKAGDQLWGLLFFNPKLKEAYKAWVKELYTRTNPYTGVALKDDPTIAVIQGKNEDSLLWWTLNDLPAAQKRILGQRFAAWAAEAHGSLDKARAAWGDATAEGDDFSGDSGGGGVVGLLNLWDLTQPQQGGKARRASDQLRFIAELQHGFYDEMEAYYRELGCRQLTNAMNWKSADKLRLDDAERWTQTAMDVVAVNRYFNGLHDGENASWRIEPGHTVGSASALRQPLKLPTNLKQVVGHPMVITESTWVHPNDYQSEGPLLMAAYQSLTGVDAYYWFAMDKPTWSEDPSFSFFDVKGQHPWFKWTASVPQLAGQFPANALLYRLGYVRPGEPVVHEERAMASLWERDVPIIAETETFDPLRDAEDLSGSPGSDVLDVSRLAFLVGPVEWVPGGDPGRTRVADLESYIDGADKTVRSNTGEIELDYGVGVLRVDAPKAQGVAGFLKDAGGRFELGDVTITSDNDYATIQLVAMDDLPLAESRKVLVQVGTVARLTGWETRPATVQAQGKEPAEVEQVVTVGRGPWQVYDTQATITLRNPHVTEAVLLDAAGYAAESVPVRREGGTVTVELPRDTMYLVLR